MFIEHSKYCIGLRSDITSSAENTLPHKAEIAAFEHFPSNFEICCRRLARCNGLDLELSPHSKLEKKYISALESTYNLYIGPVTAYLSKVKMFTNEINVVLHMIILITKANDMK